MKRILFCCIVGLLAATSLPLEAQSPISNFSLMGGYVYNDRPERGHGRTVWGDGRLLFGRDNGYRILSFGAFVNGVYVADRFDGYTYEDREAAFGLAINWGSQYFTIYNQAWSWLNIGVKLTSDYGYIGKYQSTQTDVLFYASGGVLFKNADEFGPGYMKTIMFTIQEPLSGDRISVYERDTLGEKVADKGFLQLRYDNTFVTLPLNTGKTVRFEPKAFAAVSYWNWSKQTNYALGLGISLAGQYSEEILGIEASTNLCPGKNPMYTIAMKLSITELGKSIFRKNVY